MKGPQWYAAANYGAAISGYMKMWYDFEGTGGCQGILTLYPIIEVEWRRQD
jgi:hypothetical protein